MSIEQFKVKEIAVFGMNSAGKSFVDFLNKNGIKTLILDEKNANYSDFKYEDLIEFVSRNDLKWNEIECLVVNYDDKALIELAEKKECQVFSILDFFEKYFSEYNYIGLVGESGISISCSLKKLSATFRETPPIVQNQTADTSVGMIITPIINSRIVLPREIRAMKSPTKGAHDNHHAQ